MADRVSYLRGYGDVLLGVVPALGSVGLELRVPARELIVVYMTPEVAQELCHDIMQHIAEELDNGAD